jgi:hypothetical protein
VQPDLIGLEISKGELRRLTGFAQGDIVRPSMMKDHEQRSQFIKNEILTTLVLTPIIVGLVYALIILPTIGSSIQVGIILLIVVPIVVLVGRSLWRRKTCPKALTKLLDEVDKYHAVIKAIDINDQLATSENSESILNDRDIIITALQLIREDLVRALKTERLLRDNKKLLANNQELFVNNLASLQTCKVSSQAGEYAQFLNQLLQIALAVQAEIRKLQPPS